MEKDNKTILWSAIIAAVASILSATIVGEMMLKQQTIVLQESREKLVGENAYKDLEKLRQMSFELYNLTDQFISLAENNDDINKLRFLSNGIRKIGNKLYFQAGYPFGNYAIEIVKSIDNFLLKSKDKSALINLKYHKQQFFTEYQKEIATYQKYALPGKTPNDFHTRLFMDFQRKLENK